MARRIWDRVLSSFCCRATWYDAITCEKQPLIVFEKVQMERRYNTQQEILNTVLSDSCQRYLVSGRFTAQMWETRAQFWLEQWGNTANKFFPLFINLSVSATWSTMAKWSAAAPSSAMGMQQPQEDQQTQQRLSPIQQQQQTPEKPVSFSLSPTPGTLATFKASK